jgi:hypothetical protein
VYKENEENKGIRRSREQGEKEKEKNGRDGEARGGNDTSLKAPT